MGTINVGRVILGGIVAGIVGNILGYLVDGLMLASRWSDALKALGRPELSVGQIVENEIIGLMYGVFIVWVYAAIRAHYGAGPKTAVWAGLLVWVIGILLPNVGFMSMLGLFPTDLTVMTTAGGIVEAVIAALAGAALYRERAESPRLAKAQAS
jgi:hypothetical protein